MRDYKAYEGRNPKTGERITVPPKRLPFWKTGMELKQRVDSAFAGDVPLRPSDDDDDDDNED